jgi:hypothetical protein
VTKRKMKEKFLRKNKSTLKILGKISKNILKKTMKEGI